VHWLRCASVRYSVTPNCFSGDELSQSNAVWLNRYTLNIEKNCVRKNALQKRKLPSSSSSSSVSPLCRVSTLIFLRQIMSVEKTVLQLFWCYDSWCAYRWFLRWVHCISTLVIIIIVIIRIEGCELWWHASPYDKVLFLYIQSYINLLCPTKVI
jgi:hypothetical protein